ncbi:hypothetical protein ACVR1G_04225 [Streptococcus dentasini]
MEISNVKILKRLRRKQRIRVKINDALSICETIFQDISNNWKLVFGVDVVVLAILLFLNPIAIKLLSVTEETIYIIEIVAVIVGSLVKLISISKFIEIINKRKISRWEYLWRWIYIVSAFFLLRLLAHSFRNIILLKCGLTDVVGLLLYLFINLFLYLSDDWIYKKKIYGHILADIITIIVGLIIYFLYSQLNIDLSENNKVTFDVLIWFAIYIVRAFFISKIKEKTAKVVTKLGVRLKNNTKVYLASEFYSFYIFCAYFLTSLQLKSNGTKFNKFFSIIFVYILVLYLRTWFYEKYVLPKAEFNIMLRGSIGVFIYIAITTFVKFEIISWIFPLILSFMINNIIELSSQNRLLVYIRISPNLRSIFIKLTLMLYLSLFIDYLLNEHKMLIISKIIKNSFYIHLFGKNNIFNNFTFFPILSLILGFAIYLLITYVIDQFFKNPAFVYQYRKIDKLKYMKKRQRKL